MGLTKEIVDKGNWTERTEWRNEEDLIHKEDGPAVEWKSGEKEWYINGQIHREDGPARMGRHGYNRWYLNDVEYSEEEYKTEMYSRNLKKLNEHE